MGTALMSSYYKTLCFYRNQKNYNTNYPTIQNFPSSNSIKNGTTKDREFCRKIIENFKLTPNQFKRLHSIPKKYFQIYPGAYAVNSWNQIDKVNGFKHYEEFTKIISEVTQKNHTPNIKRDGIYL